MIDYIGIGFRRCATNWLHRCLFEHNELKHYRGENVSGAHFFSLEENYSKGIEYYEGLIHCGAKNKVAGELSDSYTYPEHNEKVAERIHMHYPFAKLFCIVRNPVDRAFSDYLRSVKVLELPNHISFEEALELDPRYIQRGMYATILKYYEKYRRYGRLLVMVNEHIRADPAGFLRNLYCYLGVDDSFTPSVAKEKIGHAYMLRSSGFQRFIEAFQRTASPLFRKTGFGFILEAVKRAGVQQTVLNMNRKEIKMSPNTKKMLHEIYAQDAQRLASMFDIDLSIWGKNE